MLPWRVKNFLSNTFPLAYHIVVNRGAQGNDAIAWDEKLANEWDQNAFHYPRRNKLIEDMTEPTEWILDVGCGTGAILRHLSSKSYVNLHGMDMSNYAMNRLQEYGINTKIGRLPLIPFDDGIFDLVIASEVLEHVIRRRKFVKEICRVLKPGGRALIFVPDDCLGPISEPDHVIKYTNESLRRFLSKEMNVVDISTIYDEHHEMPYLFATVFKN